MDKPRQLLKRGVTNSPCLIMENNNETFKSSQIQNSLEAIMVTSH